MGGNRYLAVNPFAYRATDVRELAHVEDPIGPLNDVYIDEWMKQCDVYVPCWGNLSKLPKQLRPTVRKFSLKLFTSDKPVLAFGFTKSGDPMHPLTLPYSTPMVGWRDHVIQNAKITGF